MTYHGLENEYAIDSLGPGVLEAGAVGQNPRERFFIAILDRLL